MRLATHRVVVALVMSLVIPAAAAAQTPTEAQLTAQVAAQPENLGPLLDLAKFYADHQMLAKAQDTLMAATGLITLQMRRQGLIREILPPPPPPPVAALAGALTAQGQGAGAKMQPQLIDEILPDYPPILLAAKVSGVVVVDLIIDERGIVKDAHLFGRPTEFDAAVLSAVKQWKFKLALSNGAPFTPVIRRTFTFTADTKKITVTDPNDVTPPYRVGGNIPQPHQIKRVEPIYPPEAFQAKTGGMVILQAVIDTQGKVKNLTVLRHVTPALDRAAMAAVQQWEYDPVLLNGVPIEVIFTVTMNFEIK